MAHCWSCSIRARWEGIVTGYDELTVIAPSPVIALNRAVAVSRARGAAAALPLVDELVAGKLLGDYHLLPAVRGDLLQMLGRTDEARGGADDQPARTRAAARARACHGPLTV